MSTAVSDPGATLTRVVNGFSGATSSLFGFGLQTADILTGAVTDIPAYDVSLFLANLSNPVDAIGLPVAADVGLFTVGGLVEFALAAQAVGAAANDIIGAVL
jgi:hypothetical protein